MKSMSVDEFRGLHGRLSLRGATEAFSKCLRAAPKGELFLATEGLEEDGFLVVAKDATAAVRGHARDDGIVHKWTVYSVEIRLRDHVHVFKPYNGDEDAKYACEGCGCSGYRHKSGKVVAHTKNRFVSHRSPKVSVSDENLMGFGNTRHGRNAPGSY